MLSCFPGDDMSWKVVSSGNEAVVNVDVLWKSVRSGNNAVVNVDVFDGVVDVRTRLYGAAAVAVAVVGCTCQLQGMQVVAGRMPEI